MLCGLDDEPPKNEGRVNREGEENHCKNGNHAEHGEGCALRQRCEGMLRENVRDAFDVACRQVNERNRDTKAKPAKGES